MASWDAAAFNERLAKAADEFDRPTVVSLCDEFVRHLQVTDELYPLDHAKKTLGTLRKKRFFDLMQRVADALIQSGQQGFTIRRQYAQSLIDQGNLTAAETVLKALLADSQNDPEEYAETRGLLGRIYKQMYVNSPDRSGKRIQDILVRGVEEYYQVYKNHPDKLWHGINTVALLCRAERDRIKRDGFPNPRDIAREIVAAVDRLKETKEEIPYWDLATAAEACVALDNPVEAVTWIGQYVLARGTDAFELASTLRQFEEVWQLHNPSPLGALLLPILRAFLLSKEGGVVDLRGTEVGTPIAPPRTERDGQLERILGAETTRTLDWWDQGRERCLSVARISDSTNRPKGTGFLVRGNDLDPRCGAEAFLLTNAHVVSDDPPVVNKGALRPDEAVVSFQAIGGAYGASPRLKIKKLLWTSAPWELDTTLLRLEKPVEGSSICPIERTPPTRAHTDRVYVIGHPGGRDIEISLYDNLLLGFQDPRVHYRAPTEGGSSGSPVFDDKWRVIALHHAGFGETPKLNQKPGQHETYAANEGIWIEAICQALAKVETVC